MHLVTCISASWILASNFKLCHRSFTIPCLFQILNMVLYYVLFLVTTELDVDFFRFKTRFSDLLIELLRSLALLKQFNRVLASLKRKITLSTFL